MKEQRKKGLLPLCFSLFLGFIALIWETSVTLVTAKINIAVGMRATRVREKVQLSPPPCFLTLSLHSAIPHRHLLVLETTNSKIK